MKSKLKSNQGALTVEAALVLPLFLCVILTMVYFMKIYHTHEIMQHALDETAELLAETAYLWYGEESKIIGQKALDVFQLGDNEETSELMILLKEQALNEVGAIVAKTFMKHHILNETDDLDKRLKKLYIVDGLRGLNFRKSTFLGEYEEIDIIVSYKIKIPLPIQLLGEIPIIQRSSSRAWLSGGTIEIEKSIKGEENVRKNEILASEIADEVIESEINVWDFAVFKRGRMIKEMLGTNIHRNFPTIDKIEGRTITSIRTHDTRRKSNTGRGLYTSILVGIRELDVDLQIV
ncbi:pilus assembly protein [bacterium AH-315-K05]|nr:pilus assembly protein [bacterium AH-315-K05]MBN4074746.1 pilus assembly protein [bacterium AH-315-E09]